MCNECGNCAVFCPYAGRPYKDKFTLFWSEEDFTNSENEGFFCEENGEIHLRLDDKVEKNGHQWHPYYFRRCSSGHRDNSEGLFLSAEIVRRVLWLLEERKLP